MADPRALASGHWRPTAAAAVASDGAAVGWSRTPEPAAVVRKRKPLPAPVRPLPRPPSNGDVAVRAGPAAASSAPSRPPVAAPARPMGGLLFLQAEVEAEMLASVQAEEDEKEARRKRAEAEKKKAEEEKQRLEAERRKAEEERQRLEAEKRKAEAEAEKKRAEEERLKAEAEKERVEAWKKIAEAEAAHAFQYMNPLPAAAAALPHATEASAKAARDLAAALRAAGSHQPGTEKSPLVARGSETQQAAAEKHAGSEAAQGMSLASQCMMMPQMRFGAPASMLRPDGPPRSAAEIFKLGMLSPLGFDGAPRDPAAALQKAQSQLRATANQTSMVGLSAEMGGNQTATGLAAALQGTKPQESHQQEHASDTPAALRCDPAAAGLAAVLQQAGRHKMLPPNLAAGMPAPLGFDQSALGLNALLQRAGSHPSIPQTNPASMSLTAPGSEGVVNYPSEALQGLLSRQKEGKTDNSSVPRALPFGLVVSGSTLGLPGSRSQLIQNSMGQELLNAKNTEDAAVATVGNPFMGALASLMRPGGSQQAVTDNRESGRNPTQGFGGVAEELPTTLQKPRSQDMPAEGHAAGLPAALGFAQTARGLALSHVTDDSSQEPRSQPPIAQSTMADMTTPLERSQTMPLKNASGLPLDPALLKMMELQKAMGAPLDPALLQMAHAMSQLRTVGASPLNPLPTTAVAESLGPSTGRAHVTQLQPAAADSPKSDPQLPRLPPAMGPFSTEAIRMNMSQVKLPDMATDAQTATTSRLQEKSVPTFQAAAAEKTSPASSAVATEPDPTLVRIRAGIAAGDKDAVKSAVLAAEQASVPIEPHVRSMLQQWLGEDLPTSISASPKVQSSPGALAASAPLTASSASSASPLAPVGIPPDPSVQAALRATEEQLRFAQAEIARLEAQAKEVQQRTVEHQQVSELMAVHNNPQAMTAFPAASEESQKPPPAAEPPRPAAPPGTGVVIARGPMLRGSQAADFEQEMQELFAVAGPNDETPAEDKLPADGSAAESAEPADAPEADAGSHSATAAEEDSREAFQHIANDGSFMAKFLAMQQEQAKMQQELSPPVTPMAASAEQPTQVQNQEDDEASAAKRPRLHPPDAEEANEEDTDATVSPSASADDTPAEEAPPVPPEVSQHAAALTGSEQVQQEEAKRASQPSLPAGWGTEPEEKKPKRQREAWEYMKTDTWGAGNFFSFDSFK